MDLDAWITRVQQGEYLAEDELKALCDHVRTSAQTFLRSARSDSKPTQVKEVLVEESNVQPIQSPVTVN